jgi:hypothetical protein
VLSLEHLVTHGIGKVFKLAYGTRNVASYVKLAFFTIFLCPPTDSTVGAALDTGLL